MDHKVILTGRNLLSITGVNDVISFDVKEIFLETSLGMLTVKGKDLHMKRLSLDKGEVDIEGEVVSCVYSDVESLGKTGESLFARMFK